MPRFGDGIDRIVSIILMERSICLCIGVMVSLFETWLVDIFHLHALARYSCSQALRLLLEVDQFPPALSPMTHFRTTVSSVGHLHEPLGLGNIQPESSWSTHIVNPDSVAPRQQDITQSDTGDRDAKDIGIHSSELHIHESSAMDPTFLFSTMCFQPTALAFRSCNLFMNGIYDLFGLANDNRTDQHNIPKEIIYGQPSFLEKAVSTVDFTDGLPPTDIIRNKGEQTRYSALSSQISLIQSQNKFGDFWRKNWD